MPLLKVLISGAGIAGSALAFWLAKLSHEVTVVERLPSLRINGLQPDLRAHGIEVMKRMGLESAFRSHSAPEQGLQVVNSLGRWWGYFPANKSGKGPQGFTSDFEIMRGDLFRIIYDVTKERVKYVFGTSIETFDEKGGSLEVRFTDGRTDQFDIPVGADGQGSRTHKMMRGSNSADAFHPFGEYIAYFTIPRLIKDGEEHIATAYIAPSGRFVMTRRHNPHTMQVFLTDKSVSERLKSVRRGDVREEKETFIDVFNDAGWQVKAIIESLKETEDFYCEY